MSSGKNEGKYKKFDIQLSEGPLTLYASPSVLSALEEVTTEMTIYKGVRLGQVLKAAYNQGRKDGRREIIERFEAIKKETTYLPPGRPRKKTANITPTTPATTGP
ncbi:MAG TPA: hypothetical protein PLX89_07730 [Verrucomicrobiota bacterium]|nr:hypothetical protein [Verrucomicrobiales bacterium]HRI12879.1 hypothetical protein [Verrucomicrobiota bacterium]